MDNINIFARQAQNLPSLIEEHDEFVAEQVADDSIVKKGKFVSRLTLRKVDLAGRDGSLTTEDFALDVLTAAGVDLQELTMSQDKIRAYHDVERAVKNIKSRIERDNSEKSNVENFETLKSN